MAQKILIVDDEALARSRLHELLDDIAAEQPTQVVAVVELIAVLLVTEVQALSSCLY